MRRLLVIAPFVLFIAIASTAWARDAEHSASTSHRASCPAGLPTSTYAPDSLVKAARQQLPRLYAGLMDGGQPVPINPKTYEIIGIVRLLGPPVPAFVAPLRKEALKVCPSRVVDRSWAVSVDLARVQLPASHRVLFASQTRSGWVFWYHS